MLTSSSPGRAPSRIHRSISFSPSLPPAPRIESRSLIRIGKTGVNSDNDRALAATGIRSSEYVARSPRYAATTFGTGNREMRNAHLFPLLSAPSLSSLSLHPPSSLSLSCRSSDLCPSVRPWLPVICRRALACERSTVRFDYVTSRRR